MVAPLGPWQTPSKTLQACPRHRGLCAYRQGDPARCDACHRLYATITGHDGETLTEHAQWHAQWDSARAADIARLAAKARAERGLSC